MPTARTPLAAFAFTASLGSFAQFTCSPLADYPLNGTAIDVSSNGNDGVVYGATPTTDRFGFAGQAMHFDGISARIDLPSDFDVPERTWAYWFKADVIDGTYREIYDDDNDGIQNAQTELFFIEEGGVKKIKMNMGTVNTVYQQPVNEGQWYHMAQVRSAVDVRFYINGCLVFTSTDLSNGHSIDGLYTVALGTGRMHDSNYFNGDLDGLKIFGCALSAVEIDSLANGQCSPDGNQCTIIASYPLDASAADVTFNGFDGTVVGTTPMSDHLGDPDAALHFNGISDHVDLPVDFDLPERTWALWCKADVIDASVHEVYDDDHDAIQNAQTELFFREDGGVKQVLMNMGSTNTAYAQPVNEGEWNHYAQVRSATDVRFYINGCLVFTSTDLSNVHSLDGVQTVTLGTGRTHDDYYFEGDLDDVRIYSCALDAADIDELADYQCSTSIAPIAANAPLLLSALGDDRYRIDPFRDQGSYHLEVFDAMGRSVISARKSGTATIDLSAMNAGVYLLRAMAGDQLRAGKVVVVR